MKEDVLFAGAGIADITPPPGAHLAGDGMGLHRPARRIYEPLLAKALVLKKGNTQLCIISADLLCITLEYSLRIKKEIKEKYGIPCECVMIHVEQNHSAPSLGMMMLDPEFPLGNNVEKEYIGGSESAYCEFAVNKIIKAVDKAYNDFSPVKIEWGRGVCDGVSFNRRGVMRNGKITMPWFYKKHDFPVGPAHILYMEGPSDPEIGIIRLHGKTRDIFLLNFACHPVNVFATNKFAVSADWPGALSLYMQQKIKGCVPVVLNGCCGNLNPWPPFTPDFVPDYKKMGFKLGTVSYEVIKKAMNVSRDMSLDFRSKEIFLDYRDVPYERKKEAEKILKESKGIKWNSMKNEVDVNWFYAASTKSIELCRKRWRRFPYTVQVFRVGNCAIVGLPGEPFVEGQLEIKMNSPASLICVAHMCNQYVGYIPTRQAAMRGGHEANEIYTYWAKLAPDSLDVIVKNVKEMIEELFK